MNNLSEKIKKAFEEDSELCLVDECPKDLSCGECWNREVEKYMKLLYEKTIDNTVEYLKCEWAMERLDSFADFDNVAKILKDDFDFIKEKVNL